MVIFKTLIFSLIRNNHLYKKFTYKLEYFLLTKVLTV